VLDMVERRTFRKAEFTETADGHVRLLAPLTHELAETMPLWAKWLGPIAEHVAHVFGKAMDGSYSAATPRTSRRRRDAQAVVKARKVEASRRAAAGRVLQRPIAQPAALALWSCPDCGGAVTNPRHVRCEACIVADPAQAPEIRGRRGAAIAARKRALTEWDKVNPDTVYDPELFRRDILPKLGTVPLAEIMDAAGCCKASASDYRHEKRTHVSAWSALGELGRVGLGATRSTFIWSRVTRKGRLRHLIRGGEKSNEEIYAKHAEELIRFATGLVGPTDAADVVSSAVLACMSSRQWPEVTNSRAYLFRGVLIAARQLHRSSARRELREQRWATPEEFEHPEIRPEILAAVNALSVRQRAVTVLTYWFDLDPSSISRLLDISEGSIRRHLARARARLKDSLDAHA
jgi:RNA polymerase sigma factor (sigma-70 family)